MSGRQKVLDLSLQKHLLHEQTELSLLAFQLVVDVLHEFERGHSAALASYLDLRDELGSLASSSEYGIA